MDEEAQYLLNLLDPGGHIFGKDAMLREWKDRNSRAMNRLYYVCKCGRVCTPDYLNQFEPVSMAYDLAVARLCFSCYGRDLETSKAGGETYEKGSGGGSGSNPDGSSSSVGQGTGDLSQ